MAVTLTTQFYNKAGDVWKSLSKIVFTSPNIDSPNTAGVRSHILPGGGIELGLWYEDSTNMYRMADCQQATVESMDGTMNLSCSGTLSSGTCASGSGTSCFNIANSVSFTTTFGECYSCRLTAWDDATHSTTVNEIIAGDHCRVSAAVQYFTCSSDTLEIDYPSNFNVLLWTSIRSRVYNRILKGDTQYMGTDYYFGDFDMQYRATTNVTGDLLYFKPMLYGIHSGISYGVHDFVIVLHYSYT